MNNKQMEGVTYLEASDFDNNGNLIADIPKNMEVVIMIQAGFCGWCTKAKPEFIEFAKNAKKNNILACSIQTDGNKSDFGDFGNKMSKITSSQGVPDFVSYKGGRKTGKKFTGERTAVAFLNFAK
jgi:thiol-disulfide isomerase/thioredoxin